MTGHKKTSWSVNIDLPAYSRIVSTNGYRFGSSPSMFSFSFRFLYPLVSFLSFSFFAHFNFSLLPCISFLLFPTPFPLFPQLRFSFLSLSLVQPVFRSLAVLRLFPNTLLPFLFHLYPYSLMLPLMLPLAPLIQLFFFFFLSYVVLLSLSLSLLVRVGFTNVKAPDQDLDNFTKNKQLSDLSRDDSLEKAASNESTYIIYGSKICFSDFILFVLLLFDRYRYSKYIVQLIFLETKNIFKQYILDATNSSLNG